MLDALRKLFSPPIYDDEEAARSAHILNIILWVSIVLLVLLRIIAIPQEESVLGFFTKPISLLIPILFGLLFLAYLGYTKITSFLLICASWVMLLFQARSSTGIYDTAFAGSIVIILFAGLLLDFRYSMVFAILTILAGWGLAYNQSTSLIPVAPDNPFNIARDFTVIFLLLIVISNLTITGLRNAILRARQNSIDLLKSNQDLQHLRVDLEKRVEERTLQLEERGLELEKQAAQLKAVSDVSHSIASIQDIELLLPAITSLISERFDFYHTGIFILNETGDYAVLRAASSEGGKRMIARGHKLLVEVSSLVGFTASRGKSRFASNDVQDIVSEVNPDLPETKSEVALPLLVGTEIIGVLDIQSSHENAFSGEYLTVLETLANQVATAIQNARLFSETRQALSEAEKIYTQFIQRGWQKTAAEALNRGYRYSLAEVNPFNAPIDKLANNLSTPGNDSVGFTTPIKLRNQVIGVLNIKSMESGRVWDDDELALIQAAADRAGLALENARLLEDSQRRAAKEQTIGDISSKINAAINRDNILQTAVQELGSIMPDTDIVIQFSPNLD